MGKSELRVQLDQGLPPGHANLDWAWVLCGDDLNVVALPLLYSKFTGEQFSSRPSESIRPRWVAPVLCYVLKEPDAELRLHVASTSR